MTILMLVALMMNLSPAPAVEASAPPCDPPYAQITPLDILPPDVRPDEY